MLHAIGMSRRDFLHTSAKTTSRGFLRLGALGLGTNVVVGRGENSPGDPRPNQHSQILREHSREYSRGRRCGGLTQRWAFQLRVHCREHFRVHFGEHSRGGIRGSNFAFASLCFTRMSLKFKPGAHDRQLHNSRAGADTPHPSGQHMTKSQRHAGQRGEEWQGYPRCRVFPWHRHLRLVDLFNFSAV